MKFNKIWMHNHFFQSKMTLDIPKRVKDMDNAEEDEENADLEEKVMAASTSQLVDHMKQTSRSATLTMAIQNPSLTKQRLNAIIVKR